MSRRALAVLVACALAGGAARPAPAAPPPRLSAPASVLLETSTGRAVYARNARQPRAIASTTKIMTVLLALERRRPGDVLRAPAYLPNPAETQIGLRRGERMTVGDLVRAALLPSANDAANALATGVGGSRARFVSLMNARARALGLRATRYTTPVGLDTPGNHSSALDLARLAVVLRREPFARRAMDLPRAVLRSGDRRRVVESRNRLVRRVGWVDGVKTGHTRGAGYVLVASGTRGGLTFVSAVLGTASEAARDRDSLELLRWGFATFRRATPVRAGTEVGQARVVHDDDKVIPLVAARGLRRLVRRSSPVRVVRRVPRELEGPLPRGAVVGSLIVRVGGRSVGRVDVVTGRAVPSVALATRAGKALTRPGTLVGVALFAGVVALLVFNRRVARRRRRRPRRPVETA